jgi:esterase/lipase
VLTGAPGRVLGDLARNQLLKQFGSLPNIEIVMKYYDEAIAEFLANKSITINSALPEDMKNVIRSLETPANLPFSRELWAYSLTDHIARVNEPIFVVIGKNDIQVDWKIDGKALEKATTQNTLVSFVYPENANHILKHEETPKEKLTSQYVMAHYNAQDAELDREATNAIVNWLKIQQEVDSYD